MLNNDMSAVEQDWWRGAVIYQIYPRSFQDGNNDGVGDLKGIIKRLPYIASLGVDAIWISPFFKSPMTDFGYDVSDYCDVDPLFGTLQDFDELIKYAHSLGLKILIDLVLSHTSEKHPWFIESRSSSDNEFADWYVWADAKEDGSPPNNWLSIFGGSAWTWDATRLQYYLHNFLDSQPDLNYHNPDVQNAVLEATRFWLERGVDGFRLDTINFYFHDKELRDNPALPEQQRNSTIAPAVNPYNYQYHLYDKSQPENIEFLEKFRSLLDEYGSTMSVGEIGDAQKGMDLLIDYTKGDSRVHMCYSFEFLGGDIPTSTGVQKILQPFLDRAAESWSCWALSNHDVVRHATRWLADEDSADEQMRCLASMLFSLRGSVCIYQGEELGLTESDIAYEDIKDPYGLKFWPKFKGRDGCRTPMPWNNEMVNMDFSQHKPWLPVDKKHANLSVNNQENNPQSLLNYYRSLIKLRKQLSPIIYGEIKSLSATEQVLQFVREYAGKRILCIFNLSQSSATIVTSTQLNEIDRDLFPCTVELNKILLPAWGSALFEIVTEK